MAASAVTLTGSSSEEILAADPNRDVYVLQLHTQEPVYLAFGEAAVTATGIGLLFAGDTVEVRGPKAREQCNGYAAATPTIGIETVEDIIYRPGPNRYPTS
jgi:hypothetical protein